MGTSYNYYRVFGCFNRKFKISESQPPPDVREAFWRYAEGAPQMTAEQLLKFLVDSQCEQGSTAADAEAIIRDVFRRRSHVSRRNGLTLEDFFDFLFQDDLNGPINTQEHHDMSGPLQHYFIYTGHNSYLTGNQLSSDCSETPIIKALENGVRGIELDLWPNSAKDNVHVLHGRTLTAPVTLSKCFKSIREHAFVKSPYPVIITLEDHLTPDLQAKVAEMVMQIFGGMLYCPESKSLDEFPSPEALKHKIILSTKPPKEYLGSNTIKDGEIPQVPPQEKDSSEDEELPTETTDPIAVEPPEHKEDKVKGEIKEDCDRDYEDGDASEQKLGNAEYKQRIAVRAGNAKKGLRQALRTGIDKVNRRSLSGRKAILSNKPPKDNIGSNTIRDGEITPPQQKDSSEDEELPTETTDPTAGPPEDKEDKIKRESKEDGDRDDEDGDASQQKSGNAEYKHRIALRAGNAKKGLKQALRTRIDKVNRRSLSERKDMLSTKPPKEYTPTPQEKDSSEDEDEDKSSSDEDDEDGDSFQQKTGNVAAPEYKRIIAIHAGNAKKGLRHALRTEVGKVNHRLSLSEQRLEKAASLYAVDVVRFTQKNILRVFPKGTRVTSSNFRPTTGWMHGAQMVAFNMQGYGKSLWMMHGLFRANGGCGYFKKPDLLMKRGPDNEVFDPKLTLPVKKTLKVTVYMGDGWRLDFSHTHFDAYSPPDFYTKVYIVGVPADAAKRKTRVIEDDWTPYWDEEFSFPLTVPELALLRIEVREYDMSEKDDFGGQTCLPVSELRPGIRSVPLYDKKGQKYKSVRLLMRFHFE